jgi:hypothetical protein
LSLTSHALQFLGEQCRHGLLVEQNFIIETETLLIQIVDGLHFFHAFLECLHLLLKSNLGLVLVISLLGLLLLKLAHVVSFLLVFFVLEVVLQVTMLLEQSLDFFLISLKDLMSFSLERLLNFDELIRVIKAGILVLLTHTLD